MISYLQDSLVLHRHGDAFERMSERHDIDAADLDPEREWVKGTRAFQCPCGDVFVIGPTETPDRDAGTPRAEPA